MRLLLVLASLLAAEPRGVEGFKRWLEREPFFLSPATDLGGLADAAEGLARAEAMALERLEVEPRVYPAAFLAAYADASAAFDRFASSPTAEGAREVMGHVRRGVRAYAAQAEVLARETELRFKAAGFVELAGMAGQNVTDGATVRADLALIVRNAEAAGRRLRELEACLDGTGPCRDGRGVPPEPAPPAALGSAPLGKAALGPGAADARGPYLVETRCWGGRARSRLYHGERAGLGGRRMQWDTLADEMFFRELEPRFAAHRTLLAKGYKFVPQSATSPYECPDLGYKPALLLLDRYAVERTTPAAEALRAAAPEAARAAEAERAFAAEAVKSQATLERLGRAYLRAYDALEGVDAPGKDELLARGREILLKTAGLGRVVERVSFHLNHYAHSLKAAKLPRDRVRASTPLFLTRSHYSLLFMPFSPSVWLLPERPACVARVMHRETGPIFGYREAVKRYGGAEVERTVARFYGEMLDLQAAER